MDPDSPDNNADTSEGTRSQEIQNLKNYLERRFGKLPVLPGDPRTVPGNFDPYCRNHDAASSSTSSELIGNSQHSASSRPSQDSGDQRKIDDKETANAVTALRHRHDSEYFRHPRDDTVKTESGGRRDKITSKAPRFTYSQEQVEALVTAYSVNPYPTRLDRENLECMLGLSAERIKNWFQNRRSKERRKAKQNNTPVPAALLLRDMRQTHHFAYAGHPHLLRFMRPQLPQAAAPEPSPMSFPYLRPRPPSQLPPQEVPSHHSHSAPHQIPDSQYHEYGAFRPNWTLPWSTYPYNIPTRKSTTVASGLPLPLPTYTMPNTWQNTTWPTYYHESRYMNQKPHTATSENGHFTDWSPPPSLSQRPNYAASATSTDRASNARVDVEECLSSSTRPGSQVSQLTWYNDMEQPVDVNSVEEVGEEPSLRLEDSGYSVGDTSQSDASSYTCRSLLDDSSNIEASSTNAVKLPNFPSCSQATLDHSAPFPLLPLVPSNGQMVNYSPISPPLAQDLDTGCPSLDGYQVFALTSAPSSCMAKSLPSCSYYGKELMSTLPPTLPSCSLSTMASSMASSMASRMASSLPSSMPSCMMTSRLTAASSDAQLARDLSLADLPSTLTTPSTSCIAKEIPSSFTNESPSSAHTKELPYCSYASNIANRSSDSVSDSNTLVAPEEHLESDSSELEDEDEEATE